MEYMNFSLYYSDITTFTSFLDSLLSIGIILMGVLVYIRKKDDIATYFSLLKNYSLQDTIQSLHAKLDQLSDYNADDKDQEIITEIESIMREIVGQVKGNECLLQQLDPTIISKFEHYISHMDELSNPIKRGYISQFRENIKSINVKIYDQISRGKNNG